MLRKRLIILLLIVFNLCASKSLIAQENISWITLDSPPYYIQEGPLKGKGISDEVDALIQENLPGYSHLSINASFKRLEMLMKRKGDYCASNLIRNKKRMEFMYFSRIPSVIGRSLVALSLDRSDIPTNKETDQIDIQTILTNTNLIIGLERERSYGKFLDKLFEDYGGKSNLYYVQSIDSGKKLYHMLVKKRIDIILDYDAVFKYQLEHFDQKKNKILIKSHSLKGLPPYVFGHVACAKTENGMRVIKAVENVLLKYRETKRYREIMRMWHLNQEEFDRLYDKHFLSVTI